MSLVGQTLPAFALPDGSGATVTDQDLRGRWTVIYAYPKDNTPGCTQESCDFRDHHGRLLAKGVAVFGISKDSPASHTKFAEKFDLPFPLLADTEKILLSALGAYGTKVMYGKEVQGIIRSTFLVDPEGVIRHVWPKVSVKGHVEAVLKKVEELA